MSHERRRLLAPGLFPLRRGSLSGVSGASLIHSAGLSAHVKTVAAIEANSRQYVPEANAKWDKRYPGLFVIKDGTVDTSKLTGPGLSLPDGPLT